jgi:hypothetical protein
MRRLLLLAFMLLPMALLAQNGNNFGGATTINGHVVTGAAFCPATSGSGTTYTCSTTPSFTPVDGDVVDFDVDVKNTGPVTLSVNGSPAIAVNKFTTAVTPQVALIAGDLQANQPVWVYFDSGLNIWSLMSPTATGIAAGSFNVTPTFVTKGGPNLVGSGTTLTITAPGSIVNGNALILLVAASAGVSQVFTPPAGFTQLGSNLQSSGNARVTSAAFCKIASSESGNYAISWTNGTTLGVGWVLQFANTSCTSDGIGTAVGNLSTLTSSTFTPANANDLLLIFGAQLAGNPSSVTAVPSDTTSIASVNNGAIINSLPWGAGVVPAVTQNWYVGGSAHANDSTLMVIALPSTTTGTTTPFVSNSTNANASIGTLNVSGNANVAGTLGATSINLPNGGSCPLNVGGGTGVISMMTSSGFSEGLFCLNSANNLILDSSGNLSAISTFGGNKGGPKIFIGNDINAISQDISQDLNFVNFDTSNNMNFGCLTSACNGQTQENDITINVQTGKFIRLRNNTTDVATVTGTGLSSTAYQTAANCSSSASPAVCGSAAAGSFTIAAAGTAITVNTTAVTANSQIFVQEDETLGTKLGVTCNTGILANPPAITARTAATSFAVGITAGLAVNPVCFSYWIVN